MAFFRGQKIIKKDLKIQKKKFVYFRQVMDLRGFHILEHFGEVLRTTMVIIAAFKEISSIPTKLFVFSDDMDGLRKVPQNIPNKEID